MPLFRSAMVEYSNFGGGHASMQQKEQVMDQVRSQIAVAIAQELMQVNVAYLI